MKCLFVTAALAACSSPSPPTTNPDAGVEPDGGHATPDGSVTHPDASHVTTYAMTTIANHCDTLASPTVLPLLGLIHSTDAYSLPGAFPFFDTQRTRFAVTEQGQLLLFDPNHTNITITDPVQIPSSAAPNGFIAPLWTFHLSFVDARSAIRAAVVGTDQHAVIEWNDFAIGAVVPDQASHITMQVKLFATGVIELHYCTLAPGATTTHDETGARGSVGIESPDGTTGESAGFQTQGIS